MTNRFSKSLLRVPLHRIEETLVRAVAAAALYPFGEPASPDFLFTSGKQNRFNLSGTECLYCSETEATALDEFRWQFRHLKHGANQPVTLFFVKVKLKRTLDLTDQTTRQILGVTSKQLESNWGGWLPPSLSQQLGETIEAQSNITAIRYQSVAAAEVGRSGLNVVIFKTRLRSPDYVHILGPTKQPLQNWP